MLPKGKVAILGASNNPERYAHQAFHMLSDYGYETVLVNPAEIEVDGKNGRQKSVKNLAIIQEPIDTVTMYVGAKISSGLIPDFLKLKPRRVIFNPGSENPELAEALENAGIHVVEACTLVLLRTKQFESA